MNSKVQMFFISMIGAMVGMYLYQQVVVKKMPTDKVDFSDKVLVVGGLEVNSKNLDDKDRFDKLVIGGWEEDMDTMLSDTFEKRKKHFGIMITSNDTKSKKNYAYTNMTASGFRAKRDIFGVHRMYLAPTELTFDYKNTT